MTRREKANEVPHDLILGALGEGVYGLDLEGRCTFVNEAAVRIMGWTESEIIGEPLHDIHHHSHVNGTPYPREECPIYAALTDGEVHEVDDEVFWHANGDAIPVEYVTTPVKKAGGIVGAVVVFKDISERCQLELERERALKEVSSLKVQLEQERDYLREELRSEKRYRDIVGTSDALQRTLSQIEAVAATPASVLIQGESGVGKEAIARAIHDQSPRADAPMVKVNCASIPSELFESEFFGHVKGAFTGAHRDRVGRLQLADGGTLFLDEVGEIPISQQGKLLRALQEHEFERIGDDKTIKVDVRIVAATNRNLAKEIDAGRFREDLYYRLSVFPIDVPPLRARKEDLPQLAQYFVTTAGEELGREQLPITKQHLAMLEAHDWPGNIRELKNVIERALILSTGSRLRLDRVLTPEAPKKSKQVKQDSEFLTEEEFRALEKANLLAALTAAEWRVSGEGGVAELMGLKASTVSYRMKTFGIEKPN
ncbi:MAG: sigma 54-interacting transcriptional regulator [Pseudomonadaceae bacterium]|nr:sigma 54-interacting transcriptional regulator [Pseudomonadaceae bacterium]